MFGGDHPRTVQRIQGDLYRALVYAITGSESQHYRLRCLIVEHLRSLTGTEQELRLHGSLIGNYDTVEEYIVHSQMDQLGPWGSEVEMALLAHTLGINVASFNASVWDYATWSPGFISTVKITPYQRYIYTSLVTTSTWFISGMNML